MIIMLALQTCMKPYNYTALMHSCMYDEILTNMLYVSDLEFLGHA